MRSCFISFVALLAILPAAHGDQIQSAPPPARLVVRVMGLRSDRGNVALTLFKGADGFPTNDRKAADRKTVAIDKAIGSSAPVASVTFDQLTPGEYAIALLHDENKNGKMDTSLGYPREGFGVSNNPRPRWGTPRYKDARFIVSEGKPEQTLEIKVVYL